MNEEKVYNKLVRDLIPKIIKESGKECSYHIANKHEYEKALLTKLQEEVLEFIENPSVEEMGDILEVLDGLKALFEFKDEEVKQAKENKKKSRGGFKDKIVLEVVKNIE